MTEIVSVYATFANDEEARRIARTCIEEKLAACANFWPIASIYRWQGAIEEAQEFAALFKTSADRAEALIARIAALHSYDVPAAVVWPIADALADYGAWVREETVSE
jgi:periplasmic divalent cation tolerance protein